jgi:hypothetical protein
MKYVFHSTEFHATHNWSVLSLLYRILSKSFNIMESTGTNNLSKF